MWFKVRVVDNGQITDQRVQAADASALANLPELSGKVIVSFTPEGKSRLSWSWGDRFPAVSFLQELASLLRAGLGLVESLQVLLRKEQRETSQRVLSQLLDAIRAGHTFSAALAQHPAIFDDVLVATIRASETSGNLLPATERYLQYRREMDQVKRKLMSTLLYPITLSIVGMAVMVFLLMYVVPRFSLIFEDIRRDLPLFSRLLMHLGGWINTYQRSLLIALALLVSAMTFMAATPQGRRWLLAPLLLIPAFARRQRYFALSRLYRSLALLLGSGIALLQSLNMVRGGVAARFDRQLAACAVKLQEGYGIAHSFNEQGLATEVAASLLAVGEQSGDLSACFHRIADFHDEDNERWLERFSRLFEPLLMLGIGIGVGGIVVLMYMPIFELASALQ